MRVAVTGISGYLGQILLDQLEADPRVEAILGIDVQAPKKATPKLTFVLHELGEPGLELLFREHGVEHAIHLAFPLTAPASVPASRQMARLEHGLQALLSTDIQTLIVASSSVVFGAHPENQGKFIAEDAPRRPEPDLPYANQKVRMEDLLTAHAADHPECRIVILRVVTIFGPNVHNFISRSMEKPVITLPSSADPLWQFIHEEDCARAFVTALHSPIRGTYHLGADRPVHTRTILRAIGVPVVRLPYSWLEVLSDRAWRRGISSISENPGSVTGYLVHPPILDNRRFIHDTGFRYRYDCAATFLTFANTRLQGLRWAWLLPLLAITGVIASPLPSFAKLFSVLLVTAMCYLPLTPGEWMRTLIAGAVFLPMDVLSTRQGAFSFAQADFFGIPYYEPVLWPLLLLTLGRIAPLSAPRFDPLTLPLAVFFAVPFALIHEPMRLLLAAGSMLLLLLARFHRKPDSMYAALMIAIGIVWEHAGVWSGQWRYPAGTAAVPLWSSVLWAGVGVLAYRLLLPFTEPSG